MKEIVDGVAQRDAHVVSNRKRDQRRNACHQPRDDERVRSKVPNAAKTFHSGKTKEPRQNPKGSKGVEFCRPGLILAAQVYHSRCEAGEDSRKVAAEDRQQQKQPDFMQLVWLRVEFRLQQSHRIVT